MRPVVVDTNVVSYMVKNHALMDFYFPLTAGRELTASFMTVAELHEGAKAANWGARRWDGLARTLARFVIVPATDDVIWYWSEIRVTRRRQPISVADAWIAATALAAKSELVTHNAADFRGIPGLTVLTAAA